MNNPRIADVKAKIDRINDGETATKAYASITIANCFHVGNIRIAENKKGNLYVAMPFRSYTASNGDMKFNEICHPTSAEMRALIDQTVMAAYNEAIAQTQGQSEDEPVEVESPDEASDLAPEPSMG